MKKQLNNFYRGLTALSALAVLAPITGDNKWLSFLSFLSFFALIKTNYDERMRDNLNKVNRNGYYTSLLCIAGLLVFLSSNPAIESIVLAVQAMVVICSIVTAASFVYFEKTGQ
jgi:hypothetical protein